MMLFLFTRAGRESHLFDTKRSKKHGFDDSRPPFPHQPLPSYYHEGNKKPSKIKSISITNAASDTMSAIKNPSQIYSSLVTTALALGGWLGGCP
jgi:hypothetical protein